MVQLVVNGVQRCTEAKNRKTTQDIYNLYGYSPVSVGELTRSLAHTTNNINFQDKDEETRNYGMIAYLIDRGVLLLVKSKVSARGRVHA